MEVILLERVAKLGQMGEVVRVKDGYARNYLLPKGKALRATADNKKRFESMKTQLEARNLELKGEADKVGTKLDGQRFMVLRQASEAGQLYGSVSPRDLANDILDSECVRLHLLNSIEDERLEHAEMIPSGVEIHLQKRDGR